MSELPVNMNIEMHATCILSAPEISGRMHVTCMPFYLQGASQIVKGCLSKLLSFKEAILG